MTLRLTDYDVFAHLVAAASLKSRTYDRTVLTFEAVDRLEEIMGIGDRVLVLARNGWLPPAQAEALLQELMACFTAPLEHPRKLDDIKRILRRGDE